MNAVTRMYGPGPWDDEPDEPEEWIDESIGLFCVVVRGPIGALCGYVKLPRSHPRHGCGLVECEDLHVHGGVTYTGSREASDGFFVGFDCGHFRDFSPSMEFHLPGRQTSSCVYRDWAYVKHEVLSLAQQLFNPLEALASTKD